MEEAGEGRVAAYGGGGDGFGGAYSTTRGETIERCCVGAASFLKGKPREAARDGKKAGKKEEAQERKRAGVVKT